MALGGVLRSLNSEILLFSPHPHVLHRKEVRIRLQTNWRPRNKSQVHRSTEEQEHILIERRLKRLEWIDLLEGSEEPFDSGG
jgi:hypothetical protein